MFVFVSTLDKQHVPPVEQELPVVEYIAKNEKDKMTNNGPYSTETRVTTPTKSRDKLCTPQQAVPVPLVAQLDSQP
jgi:hypothetical protein